jgi:hypothetical protein
MITRHLVLDFILALPSQSLPTLLRQKIGSLEGNIFRLGKSYMRPKE